LPTGGFFILGTVGMVFANRRGSGTGNAHSVAIFDNVFVPWERVFLCGETKHAGQMAQLFATYHRHSYTGCKPAMTDILMGSAALVADYNESPRFPMYVTNWQKWLPWQNWFSLLE
jgi:hypothetical protein